MSQETQMSEPPLVNVAETPVLRQIGCWWLTADELWGLCDSFINHHWNVGRAGQISLRLSTRASGESVPIVFYRDELGGLIEWRGQGNQGGDITWEAEEWLKEHRLVPYIEPFTRTLHISVFIHEEASPCSAV